MQEMRTRSPGRKVVTPATDGINNADAFMAQDSPRLAGGDITLEDVQIGAADRRLDDPDDRVARRLGSRAWADPRRPSSRVRDKPAPSLRSCIRERRARPAAEAIRSGASARARAGHGDAMDGS